MRIAVQIEGDRVTKAGFDADGCGALTAAASALVESIEGGPFLEACRWEAGDLAKQLGLSPPKRHAAELAADALHRALGAAAKQGAVRIEQSPRRTLVAMSGGVDSAAAAQLSLDAGDDVVAVTLELWSDPGTDGEKSCCSPQAVLGARDLAHRMGVPHITLDLRERFRSEVVDRFLDGYAAGRTPNPCVRCNGEVRFDAMLDLADAIGAGRLATGHYARIARDDRGPLIREAADGRKDQSYMLAKLDPALLDRLSFPLGGITKDAVRALAREAGLPVADKPESQDLCFVAGLGGRAFLQRHGGPRLRKPGEIVDRNGKVLGRHEGQHNYTIGQRRGLGLAAPEPLYVLKKDASDEPRGRGAEGGARDDPRPPRGGHPSPHPADVETRPASLSLRDGRLRRARPGRRNPRARARHTRERSRTGTAGLSDASGSRRGRSHHRRAALTIHPERIDLEAPLSGDFQAVVRLIIGGIAERVDFAFEEIDDLQLAVERLLAEAGQVGSVQLSFEVGESSIRTRVGSVVRVRRRRRAPRRRGASRDAHSAAHPSDRRRLLRRRGPRGRGHRGATREAQGPSVSTPQRRSSAASEKAREEDRALLRRYHEGGDTTAREELIERHLPLVRSLARRYAGRGEALEDIEQVGAIGLIKAIDRFELEREVSLATYATPNVVGEIKRHFRDKGWAIRVPRALQELNASMSGAIERLTGRLGRSPSIAEIAEELKTTPEEVLEAMEVGSAYSTVSLSTGPGGEEELDPLETIGSEDEEFERSEDRAALEPALDRLPPREREILRMRFEEGLPQTQIAHRVGLSQMHVSRLIRKSLSIMREELLRSPPGTA